MHDEINDLLIITEEGALLKFSFDEIQPVIAVIGTTICLWNAISCTGAAIRLKAPPILLLSLSQFTFAIGFIVSLWHANYTYFPSLMVIWVSGVIIRIFDERFSIKTYFSTLKTTYARVLFLFG